MGETTSAPKSKRWYQFSLRAMIALTTIVAGFFSLALTVGYADAAITLMALTLLLAVIRCPPQAHWVTGILLTAVATLMLWANLRPTRWESEFDVNPPEQLVSFTHEMFWRGWPVCPWMFCGERHMGFDAGGCFVEAAFVVNGVIYAVVLIAAKVMFEWRGFRGH